MNRFAPGLRDRAILFAMQLAGMHHPPNLEAARSRLEAVLGPGATLPLVRGGLVIRKAKRTLELYDGERLVKSWPAAFGRSPGAGPKLRKGDGRTPEGRYFVCTRNPRSRFHLFLGLSYPNETDSAAGERDGIIGADEAKAIRDAVRSGRRPPWDTAMGGEIGVHGGGSARDWTQGCVAVENEAIEELWLALASEAPVEILP